LYCEGQYTERRLEGLWINTYYDSARNKAGGKAERDLVILEAEPRTPRNVFFLGQLYENLGRLKEADAMYRQRATMGGLDEEVYYALYRAGDIAIRLNQPFHLAAATLFSAYMYRPTRFEALVRLCSLLNERKYYPESYRLSHVEPKPTDDLVFVDLRIPWRIYFEHANAAHHLGLVNEARQFFKKASDNGEKSGSAEYFIDLSLAHYQVGRWKECADAARKALELRPDFPEAYNNIAVAHHELGEWDLAIEAANEALRLKPEFQLAKNNLAAALKQKEKLAATAQ
jgi:tetratricopeptide (TPR) repeat protein